MAKKMFIEIRLCNLMTYISKEHVKFGSSLKNYTSNNTRQHEYNTTQHNTRQHEYNTRQLEYNTTQHNTTQHKYKTSQLEYNTTQHEYNTTQHEYKGSSGSKNRALFVLFVTELYLSWISFINS